MCVRNSCQQHNQSQLEISRSLAPSQGSLHFIFPTQLKKTTPIYLLSLAQIFSIRTLSTCLVFPTGHKNGGKELFYYRRPPQPLETPSQRVFPKKPLNPHTSTHSNTQVARRAGESAWFRIYSILVNLLLSATVFGSFLVTLKLASCVFVYLQSLDFTLSCTLRPGKSPLPNKLPLKCMCVYVWLRTSGRDLSAPMIYLPTTRLSEVLPQCAMCV